MSILVDHQDFIEQIPKAMDKLGFIIIKRRSQNPLLKDLKIKRSEIIRAHAWLSSGNNPLYRHIKIDFGNLNEMPEDGHIPFDKCEVIIEDEEEEAKKNEESK